MTTSVQVKVFIDPSNAPELLAAFKRAKAIAIAQPENISSNLYRNPNAPGEFKYVEDWNASVDWILKAAAAYEAIRDFFEVRDRLSIKPRETEIWTCVTQEEWDSVKE
ncbi:hypothetical protein IQ06DRAFT_305537 [Phaeosphaeriaceae sp. SRC1lsM3a]|nr:hypothetical protein IQ06DRAFT_305537 [Stagonospora sp. SRC1lsM3a]